MGSNVLFAILSPKGGSIETPKPRCRCSHATINRTVESSTRYELTMSVVVKRVHSKWMRCGHSFSKNFETLFLLCRSHTLEYPPCAQLVSVCGSAIRLRPLAIRKTKATLKQPSVS